jgi:flagellar basal-body rod protein FlgB
MELLRTHNFQNLTQLLHISSMRQAVHAHNIANADTPHFKRSEVPFSSVLDKAQHTLSGARSDERHMPIGRDRAAAHSSDAVVEEQTIVRTNENNVDIDREMALMAKNQLQYNTIIRALSQELKHIRAAIDVR